MASQAACRLLIGEATAAGQQQSQPAGGRLLRPPPRQVVAACSCTPCLASSHSFSPSAAHFSGSSSLSSRAGLAWEQQQQQQEEVENHSYMACQSRCHQGLGQQRLGTGTHRGCSSASRAQDMSRTQGGVRPRQAQSQVLRRPQAACGRRAGRGTCSQGLGNGARGSIRPHFPNASQRPVSPCQSQGSSITWSSSSSSGSSRSRFICHARGSETVSTLCRPNQGLSLAVWKGWRQADVGLHSSSSSNGSSGGKTRLIARASLGELASGADVVIGNLGLDTLTFLVATVIVVPAFKSFKASPILGFLLSGVALNELGLIRNITDVKALSELGILFLLFEMGLELSLERLRALAKFAFGIGLPQVVLTTLAFTAFELPANNAIGTQMLEFLFGSKPDLVNIRSVDEAIVIGAALSLSSSAFVLQLLSEKGELASRFGSATLGILLLQDIAVVPLLVILPILESGDFTDDTLFPLLAAAGLKSLLGLGVLLLVGRLFLRRFFEFVADSRSTEAFVALCLLTVTGTALITSKLGFSDSLGAFLAGALLAETNYRTQVEADIRPFRGLLLGLFFVTTGTSIDINLLFEEWPNILALLGGLIAIKTAIITLLGPRAGLTPAESVRTGLLLSQGGEFAFVVFALANQLGVLPLELNRLLIIVVVLSMALTPLLDSLGRKAAEVLDSMGDNTATDAAEQNGAVAASTGEGSGHGHGGSHFEAAEPIVILGFNQQGQVLGNFLASPLASVEGGGWPYVSFDLNPKRVRAAKRLGFPVLYGDGSRTAVLQSAGISQPKAVIVVYSSRRRSVESVERLHHSFPSVPIFARAMDLAHMLELRRAGATDVVLESAETSFRLGSMLLQDLGVMRDDVVFLRGALRDAMMQRAMETLNKGPADADGAIDPTAVIASTMRDSRPALPTATAVGAPTASADSSAPTDSTITSTITPTAASTNISTAPIELYDSDVEDGRAVDRNGVARGVGAELAFQRSAGGGAAKSDSIGDFGLPDYLSDDESLAGESGGANAWRTVGSPVEGDVETPPDDDSGKPLAPRAGVDSAGGPLEPVGPIRVGGGVSVAADLEKPAALVAGKQSAAISVEAAGGFGPRAAVASLASAAVAAAAAGAAGVAAAVSGVVSGTPVIGSSSPGGGAEDSVGTSTTGGIASSPPSALTVEPQADAAATVGVAAAEGWRQVGDPAGAEGSDGWDGSLGGMVLADATASSEGEEWMGGGEGGSYLYFSDGEDAVDSTLQCTSSQRLPDLTQE